ncbi:hypothetical protein [Collimonas fungivorans]|nr:hypothetical protein [Collimonas fungivorans]
MDKNNCKKVLKTAWATQYSIGLLQLSLSFGFSPLPQGWRAFFYLNSGEVAKYPDQQGYFQRQMKRVHWLYSQTKGSMKRLSTLQRDNPLYAGLLCIILLFAVIKGAAVGIAYVIGATLKLGVVGIAALLALKVLLVAAWLTHRKKDRART